MGVVLTVTGGWGSASGSGFPNTGDFALPTNDGANVGSPAGQNTYNLSGVAPGPYLVYCYAVNPGGYYVPTTVVIEG